MPEYTSSGVADAELLRLDRRRTELDKAIRLLQEIRLICLRRAPEALAITNRRGARAGVKKAGTIATAGRKATYYEATAADGSSLVRCTLHITEDTALIAAFLSEGKWIASAVVAEVQDWETLVFLPAKRIKVKRRAARE
jgi:hypothetical protein